MTVRLAHELFNQFRRLATPIVVALGLIFATSCGQQKPYASATGNVNVKVPVVKDGQFTLDIVQLTGITSLYEMQGTFAKFFFSPRLENGRLAGDAPKGRFMESHGVQVPQNEISADMAAIYYHLQNLAALDEQVGAGGINKWPRDIGIQAAVVDPNTGGELRNNAMYDGMSDSMAFVPFEGSQLPISVNAGVIAHEHFHSLFYKIVLQPLTDDNTIAKANLVSTHALENPNFLTAKEQVAAVDDKPTTTNDEKTLRDLYHWYILKALNEGLADVWGWAYSGQPDFIGFSLASETSRRTLQVQDIGKLSLDVKDRLMENVNLSLSYTGQGKIDVAATRARLRDDADFGIYPIGTKFSRFFKGLVDTTLSSQKVNNQFSTQAVTSRADVLKIIVKILPQLVDNIRSLDSADKFDPHTVIELVAKLDPQLTDSRCQYIAQFLNNSWTSEGKKIAHSPTYSCANSGGKIQLSKASDTSADQ